MPHPRVTCIILNHARQADTIELLQSLEKSDYPSLDVLVMDSGGESGAAETIRRRFPRAGVVRLANNGGYAGNNNVGIELALKRGADWVVLMNDDTIAAPDCISQLMAAAVRDDSIGMAGPTVYHYDEADVIQSAGGVLGPGWSSEHRYSNQKAVEPLPSVYEAEWVTGCAIAVRGEVVKDVGLLDARFFSYWEEVDWCRRAARAGWKVMIVPQARVWHKGVSRDYRPAAIVAYYATRNRLLFFQKHRAPVGVWCRAAMQIARTLVSMSVRPCWRGSRAHRDAIWFGVCDYFDQRWGQAPDRAALRTGTGTV